MSLPIDSVWQTLKEDEYNPEYAFDYYGTNPSGKHFGIGSYTDPNDASQRISIPFYQRSGGGGAGGGGEDAQAGDWGPFYGFDTQGGNFSGYLPSGQFTTSGPGYQIKPSGSKETGYMVEGFDKNIHRYGTQDVRGLGKWMDENLDAARFGENQWVDDASMNKWLHEQGATLHDVAQPFVRDKPGGIPWKRSGEPIDIAYQLLKEGPIPQWGENDLSRYDLANRVDWEPTVDLRTGTSTNIGLEDTDPCCEEIKQLPAFENLEWESKSGDKKTEDLTCDEFKMALENVLHGWEQPTGFYKVAEEALNQWNKCSSEQFSGDFTAGEPMDIAYQLLKDWQEGQQQLTDYDPNSMYGENAAEWAKQFQNTMQNQGGDFTSIGFKSGDPAEWASKVIDPDAVNPYGSEQQYDKYIASKPPTDIGFQPLRMKTTEKQPLGEIDMQRSGDERFPFYSLRDKEGKQIGSISGFLNDDYGNKFQINSGQIDPSYRGHGLYQRMLASILRDQGHLQSLGSRNKHSTGAHQAFQRNLGHGFDFSRWNPSGQKISSTIPPALDERSKNAETSAWYRYVHKQPEQRWGSISAQTTPTLPLKIKPQVKEDWTPLSLQRTIGDFANTDEDADEWQNYEDTRRRRRPRGTKGLTRHSPPSEVAEAAKAALADFNEQSGKIVQTGEPMDIAMQLLKATRQTELGEFHPDFPSSHGPVTGYRALSNEQRDKMIHEGLKAAPIGYSKFGANPDAQALEWFGTRLGNKRLRPDNAVWAWLAHDKKGHEEAKENAQFWADQKQQPMIDTEAKTLRQGIPSSVVAIRGQHESMKDLAMHDRTGNYPWIKDDWASHGPVAITQDIPPAQTVRMDKSFDFLKRQTELGEFHPDFPSSQGPVTEYHGTVDLPGVLSEEGIRGSPIRGRSKSRVPEDLQDEDKVVYTALMQERALQFAHSRAKALGLSPDKVGVVGVRGGGLSEPSKLAEGDLGQALSGTTSNVRAGGIPRQNIVSL